MPCDLSKSTKIFRIKIVSAVRNPVKPCDKQLGNSNIHGGSEPKQPPTLNQEATLSHKSGLSPRVTTLTVFKSSISLLLMTS